MVEARGLDEGRAPTIAIRGARGLDEDALPPSQCVTPVTLCLTAAALIVGREKARLAGTASKLPFYVRVTGNTLAGSSLPYLVNRRPCWAGFIPARRAASIEPMEALRIE